MIRLKFFIKVNVNEMIINKERKLERKEREKEKERMRE